MPSDPIIASAPGSLMLLGEHAVLHGRRALVAAINQRLRVTLIPRTDSKVEIESALAHHATTLEQLTPHPQLRFIMEAVTRARANFSSGFTLQIASDFSHTIGFGSSAAVTVATVAVLQKYYANNFYLDAICDEAIAVIRAVQGRGSGADVAASTYGGVVAYRATPREALKLDTPLTLCAVYAGYKTPTPEVIRRVDEMWSGRQAALAIIYGQMDTCSAEGIAALEKNDHAEFGRVLNRGQRLMEELGVNTPELEQIIRALRADAGISGAKISGSGMGDCAIGLGELKKALEGFDPIQIRTSPSGVSISP